ncbi:hypothetical protein Tco_0298329 [Tanacetum coccineum]
MRNIERSDELDNVLTDDGLQYDELHHEVNVAFLDIANVIEQSHDDVRGCLKGGTEIEEEEEDGDVVFF